MALWGTTAAADNNKPKFLPADEDSDYNKAECYATNAGWVIDERLQEMAIQAQIQKC